MSQLIFGKYEVLKRLALGGMGEVFLARQTGVAGFDRLVILKSLLPELAEQEGFVEQFLDEARVAATLNHPNIVGIYEVGLWNGVYFIAMEHIHGEDLARLQRAAGKQKLSIPYQVSARIIHDAALGLDHAHHAIDLEGRALGIVHRDISPQNIMVRGDGVAKVVDFGIAKASNRSTRTATGLLKGKLQYMAPEQAMGANLDGRSDQFSLGVVLWELTTGQRLFKGDNELETLQRVLQQPVPPPSSLVPGYPPELEAVVMRMLERDPNHRYAHCVEAARDLRTYLDNCSRTVGEQQVAAFVQQVMGEELEERTRNLTPNAENFVISLSGANSSNTMRHPSDAPAKPTVSMSLMVPKRRKRMLVAAAGGTVAALALGVLAVFALRPEDDVQTADIRLSARSDAGPGAVVPGTKRAPAVKKRKGATGTILEIDAPIGARVFVDGKLWPEKVPTRLEGLSPGPHQIVLEVDGVALPAEEVAIEAPPKPSILELESDPPGASVWVGGRLVGETPLELDMLAPGMDHDLQISKRGYEDEALKVKLAVGERLERKVRLTKRAKKTVRVRPTDPEPTPVVVADQIGYLTLKTTPWAKVSIDGEPYGSTPIWKEKLAPGKHRVRLVNEQEGVDVTKVITIKPGALTKQEWTLK